MLTNYTLCSLTSGLSILGASGLNPSTINYQPSTFLGSLRASAVTPLWNLEFGASLELGNWSLELLSAPLLTSLASVSTPDSALGAWLLSATAALSIAALVKQLGRKTPLEAEFLSRKEFHDFKDKDFAELRHRVDHSFQSLSDKLDAINNRLHELRSSVERMDERTKHLHVWQPEIKYRASTIQHLSSEALAKEDPASSIQHQEGATPS